MHHLARRSLIRGLLIAGGGLLLLVVAGSQWARIAAATSPVVALIAMGMSIVVAILGVAHGTSAATFSIHGRFRGERVCDACGYDQGPRYARITQCPECGRARSIAR
jgi:hypothetical protein